MKIKSFALLFVAILLSALSFAQNPATQVNVDVNANRHAINPNIYGINYGDAHDVQTLNAPINRWGGNATTRYNWQIDAHSAGSDWYFETYPDGPGTPGGSADQFLAATRSNPGSQPMFTIPMIDYLANLGTNRSTLAGFSVRKYGAQTSTDPWNSDAGNGVSSATGKNIAGNNPLDTGVLNTTAAQQAWIQHFVSTYGPSTTANGVKYYILDNEPSLWNSTHRDVHPNPATYQEMYDKIVAYATAIRAVDPNAKIAGFEEWGWWAMYFSGLDQANGAAAANSDYNTHNHTYYYPWLLQKLYAYKQQTGTQLIDMLTVHCYNQMPGNNDDSLAGQLARNRETRILWDPTFQDPSWYGDIGINGRVLNWIPTLKAMVNQYHPGLEIGCTEYNWGDEANLNGATTQADVLGIYGREGFDLATRWTVAKNTNTTPTQYYVTYLASQIYRNYDGNRSTFGDVSVSATTATPDNLSAFAATRSSDGALTVILINKQQGSTPVTVSLANFGTGATAQAWQINSASQTLIARLADVPVANNSISTTVPSQSITLFVIPSGSNVTAPTAPTGLAGAPGNGQLVLTWNASAGATSYTVKRSSVSGGPYTTVGTATTPTFTNTALTNGVTYYYVVSASNSAGASANSSEVAITPGATVAPTAPTGLVAAPGNAQVVLTWNASASATSYTVKRASVSGGPYTTVGTATTTTFTNSGLTNGVAYYYVVSASNSAGASANSSEVAATPGSTVAPTFTSSASASPNPVAQAKPTTITATVTDTAGTLSNGIVQVLVTDAGGSNVATQNFTGQTFATSQAKNYTLAYTPALAGTFRVRLGVFNSNWQMLYWNDSVASITVTSTLTFTSLAIATPSSVTRGTATSIRSTVTDTGTAALTNANVEMQVFNAGGAAVATCVWSGQNFTGGGSQQYTYSWSVPASQATGVYTIMIGVFDAGWTTNYYWNSSAGTITVVAGTAPPAPAGLSATAGNAQVTLSWTPSSGATSYNVYRGTAAGAESSTPIATHVTAASYTNTALTNGTTYFYTVAAVNAIGVGAKSNEASAKPTAVNVTSLVKLTASSWVQDKTTKRFRSTLTLQNTSQQTIAGPLEIVFMNLPGGVTLYSSSGTSGGSPYVTLSNQLGAGSSSTVKVEMQATTASQIGYAPAVYSGTL